MKERADKMPDLPSPVTLSQIAKPTRARALGWWLEGALLVIFVSLVSIQLFVRPYIGMADNGDFAKVARRFSLVPAEPGSGAQYFIADYLLSPGSRWESEFCSSEEWLAAVAFYLSRTTKDGEVFNIRWLGAIHAIVLAIAFVLVLVATRGLGVWAALAARIVILWIFTDVLYVSYLNSFYSDTPALLGLLGAVALAALIITKGPQILLLLGFTLFALLLIASKSQHALWGFLPAVLLFLVTRRDRRLPIRCIGGAASALLCVAVAAVIWMTPVHYKGEARFSLIFRKVAKLSPDPGSDLQELGLPASDVRYIGLTAYHPDSPAADEKWFADFCRRTSYSSLAAYYVRHPHRTLHILRSDLETWAKFIRFDFGNFRRQDALRPGQRSERFASWSDLRIRLFFFWPGHIIAWYALLAAGIVVVLLARPGAASVRMAWLTAGLAIAAVAEYGISSLGDSEETFRHLFLFHALTDVTVCIAVAAVLSGTLREALEQVVIGLPGSAKIAAT